MIKIICDICGSELNELGAIALSPPDKAVVIKYHICVDCWGKVKARGIFAENKWVG